MKLVEGHVDKNYRIATINTAEEGMRDFLFTLGCYPGEDITLISRVSSSYVINVKNARYSIDKDLASAIEIHNADSDTYGVCHSQAI